ncbi:MAG: helix-turn-helix domain-containing protein [Firmicutes bacterium]|nr:helix-turn-helix domain-containing protein [Bacillota bacterium]
MYQIMIVDDEPEVLDTLENYIQEANLGFHVVAKALGGEEALFFLDIINPEVIITDIKMPVLDGLHMLSRMQNMGWNGYAVLISGYDEFEYAQQAIRLNVYDYLLKPIFPDDIVNVLKGIREHYRQKEAQIDLMRMALEANIYDNRFPEKENLLPDYIIKAKTYIEEHYDGPLTLVEVAEYVAVSPGHLSSQFAKYCKKTFVEYLTSVRLRRAKELLVQSSLQIQRIAQRVGYNDVSYFNRVFRRETGQSPGSFRKIFWEIASRRVGRDSAATLE